jgi:hypothetical protein
MYKESDICVGTVFAPANAANTRSHTHRIGTHLAAIHGGRTKRRGRGRSTFDAPADTKDMCTKNGASPSLARSRPAPFKSPLAPIGAKEVTTE